MRPSQLIFLIYWMIFWSLVALMNWQNGSLPGLDSFGNHEREEQHLVTVGYWSTLAYVVFMPLFTLRFPSRTSIVLGAVAQIPLILVAYRLWWLPIIAMGIAPLVILWINAAHSQWQILNGTYVSIDQSGGASDVEGTPWSKDPSHIRGKTSHKSDSAR
jgi:hypothetical protein